MAQHYLRQSALAGLGLAARATADPAGAAIRLCERPFSSQIVLRGPVEDGRFRAVVEAALGLVPPSKPNTVAAAGMVRCLWLGPDEWLVVAPDGQGPDEEALARALAGRRHAVSEASDGRAVIGLAGPRAREVLAKGCSLDFHPSVFGVGQCAQSTLAKAQVLIHQTDAEPAYDIYVHRSFAEYLWTWLEDAAKEYGFAIVAA